MSVYGDELGWDDVDAVEHEHEAHDAPAPPTLWRGSFKRTMRPRTGVRPAAARVPVLGQPSYLYA